jgi:alpha-ketoglutaric semialdehyde dehydrogenase
MGEHLRNLIDGKWVESASSATFDDTNPANKTEVLGSFPRSDHRDIDRAVEAARTSFPSWSRYPSIRRADILYKAAHIIEGRSDDLSAVLVRESGKVLGEAQAELRDGVSMLRALAGDASRGVAEAPSPDRAGALALAAAVPLGVAGVITHWTFPLAGPLWAVASALAAGDTVVFKPTEDTPLAAARLVEILLEAGLPPASLCLVHGHGEEAGAPLVRHPEVALVAFAGSPEVGREVAITCAAEEKRLCLDLGQQTAAIVLEDADLDLAVDGIVGAGFAVAGQRWRGAARLFVQRKVVKEFNERLVARVQTLRVGDGISAGTDIGPVINETQLRRVHGHTRIGLRDGAKLLCGGEVVREGEYKRGFFYAPTVFGDAAPKMRVVQEEVLGPLLTVMSMAGLDDAIEQANTLRRAATVAVYTRDLARGLRAIEGLQAGRVCVNPTRPSPGAPLSLAGFTPSSRMRRHAGPQSLVDFGAWKEAVIESVGPRPGSHAER